MRILISSILMAVLALHSYADEPDAGDADLRAQVMKLQQAVANISQELRELRSKQQDQTDSEVSCQLDGRWEYIVDTRGETSTTYKNVKMELIIDGKNWTTVINDRCDPTDTHVVEYDYQTTPASLVRRAPKWAPGSIARAIFKVDNDHFLYTETPLVNPNALYPGAGTFPKTPTSFDPKGTNNTEYILRRVSRSTKLPANQAVNPSGGTSGF